MTRRFGFYLAELGTEEDFERININDICEKLRTDENLVFNREKKKNKGFVEAEFYGDDSVLISNYYRETTQPKQSVLVSTAEGIKRRSYSNEGEQIRRVKRGFYILWPDLRICALVNMPLDEAESLMKKLAMTLFRYVPGQGYSLYSILDDGMVKLKALGSAHSEGLEIRGVLKLELKSMSKMILDRHIDRFQYVGENGKSCSIEDSRDRFTKLGIELGLGETRNDDDDEEPPKISHAKQQRLATRFTVEGNLSSDEEFDDIERVRDLSKLIKKSVNLFISTGIIRSELAINPSLFKEKIPTLEDFV